jgi:FMN phosphatase YigB (HAD superfamily)
VAGRRIDTVLFDLGGVLVDFGGVGPMRDLSGIATDEELWQRWLTCPWVRRFERGHCTPDEFAAGLVQEWDLAISPAAFLTAFGGWPGGPLPGAAELVDEVRRAVPSGCLSNTNALHWETHAARWALLQSFDVQFLSFEMGCVKPDPELFAAVGAALALPPGRVLFLDDNQLNVEAAVEAGFQATRVQGVDEARHALVASGVLGARRGS